mgnify:CR=1 FL=1
MKLDEREQFISQIVQRKESRILEIGPLNRPIVTKNKYPNAFYCDIRSTDEVKALYSGNDYLEATGIQIDVTEIVDIDYVINESYKKTFQNIPKFDYVIASHVIEHMEDIIGFFQDITNILKPHGKLCIIYPDKRYCFDHFRESASFRDAFNVYHHGRHNAAPMALDFFFNVVHENDAIRFWQANHIPELLPQNSFQQALTAYQQFEQGQKLDDVHFWEFTDRSFAKFLYDCVRSHLLQFSCIDFRQTQVNSQQFMLCLEYIPQVEYSILKEANQLRDILSSIPEEYYNYNQLTLEKNLKEAKDYIQFLEKEKKDNEEKIQQLDEKTKIFAQQIQESTLKGDKFEQEIIGQNEKRLELETKLLQISDEFQNMQYNLGLKDQKTKELSARIITLEEDKQGLIKRLEKLQEIEDSTIWCLTKPLRQFLDWVKALF